MEKKFTEVMNTIKEGETWINKYNDRRLAKIEKSSNVIHFKFNGEFEKIGVMLHDIFVLDKKKYTFEVDDLKEMLSLRLDVITNKPDVACSVRKQLLLG